MQACELVDNTRCNWYDKGKRQWLLNHLYEVLHANMWHDFQIIANELISGLTILLLPLSYFSPDRLTNIATHRAAPLAWL